MQLKSRFETQDDVRATVKLRALVADLQMRCEVLETDIRDEEQRTGIFDFTSIAYPILARNLRIRRDNLLATIRVLESRLVGTEMAA